LLPGYQIGYFIQDAYIFNSRKALNELNFFCVNMQIGSHTVLLFSKLSIYWLTIAADKSRQYNKSSKRCRLSGLGCSKASKACPGPKDGIELLLRQDKCSLSVGRTKAGFPFLYPPLPLHFSKSSLTVQYQSI
jgi:hypothetical protein